MDRLDRELINNDEFQMPLLVNEKDKNVYRVKPLSKTRNNSSCFLSSIVINMTVFR